MKRVVMLIGGLALFVGLFGGLRSAAASTANPYVVSECNVAAGVEICYTDRGVFQEVRTPSGMYKLTVNGSYSYEIRIDGELTDSGSSRYQFNGLTDGSESLVYHMLTWNSRTDPEGTCSHRLNFVYTNGEVRHDLNTVICE
jgi:hypothetical protein